jgi:AraC-like DNA-binding protein
MSGNNRIPIEEAVDVLKTNLDTIASVTEWAIRMGYGNSKTFRRHFKREFRSNPGRILTDIRLTAIVIDIHKNHSTCDEIAWKYCLPDGKGVSNLIKYHLGCTPSDIRELPPNQIDMKLQNWRRNSGVKLGGKVNR